MNGKPNLFICCFICFCAYFYSVSANAAVVFTMSWIGTSYCNGSPAVGQRTMSVPSHVLGCAVKTPAQEKVDTTAGTCITDAAIFAAKPNGTKGKCAASVRYWTKRITNQATGQMSDWESQGGLSFEYQYEVIKDCDPPLVMGKTGACEAGCAPLKGKLINGVSQNNSPICLNECRAKPVKIMQQCPPSNISTLCLAGWAGQWQFDGAKCNGSETNVPKEDTTDDPEQLTEGLKQKMTPFLCQQKGMTSGTVNGQTICVKNTGQNNDKLQETKTESSTDENGNKVIKTTTTSTDDDGVKIIKKEESETEFRNPDGSLKEVKKASSVTEKDKSDFCKDNPNDTKCRESSIQTNCSKEFKCVGDVIACESTRLQFIQYCSEQKEISDLNTADSHADGLQILKGSLDDDSKLKLGLTQNDKNTVDVSKTFENSTTKGFLSCGNLSDKSINVMGKSIDIPFSKMNYWLSVMGKIAVVFTLVIAAKIIVGGVK